MDVCTPYRDDNFCFSYSLDLQPDPAHFKMHTHTTIELYYFLKGKGVFHIEGTAYPLEEGDLLIMKPSESHYIELDCNYSYERMVVDLTADYLRKLDPGGFLLQPILERKAGKQNRYKSEDFQNGSCDAFFRAMASPTGNPRINILCAMLPLLNEIYNIYLSRGEDDGSSTLDSLPHQIIRYINKNLSQPIHLETVCQKFYISKAQLCRLFKNATGTTVWQYITVKRMVKAKELLDNGASPTHIYYQCGFNDYSSFYRAYVKHFGCAPSKT